MVSAIFLGLVLSTHRGMIDARDQITKANKHAILPWRDIAHMPFLPASSFAFRVWKYLSRLYLRDRKREHVRGQHFGFIDAITVNFFICLRCRSHLSCRINISGAICKRHVCANGPKWSLLSLEHITLPFSELQSLSAIIWRLFKLSRSGLVRKGRKYSFREIFLSNLPSRIIVPVLKPMAVKGSVKTCNGDKIHFRCECLRQYVFPISLRTFLRISFPGKKSN